MKTDETTLNAWAASFTESGDVGYAVGQQAMFTRHPEVAFTLLLILSEDGYDFSIEIEGEDAEVEIMRNGETVTSAEGGRDELAMLIVQAAHDVDQGMESGEDEPEDEPEDDMDEGDADA
jgi:hypothetical protein